MMSAPSQNGEKLAVDAGDPGERASATALSIRDLTALGALSAVVFFLHLGSYGLWEPDEGRYAEIGREMATGGSLIVPHLNYVPYVEKPPLLYWLTAGWIRLLGPTELAVRLTPALAALLGVLLTYFFVRRVWERRRALLAGAILATCPLYATMAQVLTTDMLLALLLNVAFFAFYLQWREGGLWWVGFYVASALAILTKGPVGLVLPVLCGGIFAIWSGDPRNAVRRMRPIAGAALVAAIALPWFAMVAVRLPDFARFYFVDEHLRRFLQAGYSHSEPIYYFIPVVLVGLIPWSLLGLFTARYSVKSPARDYCLVVAVTVLCFFSLASAKLISYILPLTPPLAALIADATLEALPAAGATKGEPRALALTWTLITLLGAVALALGEAGVPGHGYVEYLQLDLRKLGLTLVAGSLIGSVLLNGERREASLGCMVLTAAAALIVGGYGRLHVESMRSYARMARTIEQRAPDAPLICYHRYVQSLPFYSGRRVILVGPRSELEFGYRHGRDAAEFFGDDANDLIRLWHSLPRAVVVIDRSDLDSLANVLDGYQVIAAEHTKRAIVRPSASAPTPHAR